MIRQSCSELGRFEEEELLHLQSNNQGGGGFSSLQPHALCYLLKYCLKNRAYMMKCKANQTRTYDGDGFKRRAACLCLRNEKEDEVLLVSSSRHPDQWIVPGGGMEPDEEPGVAAVREVYEEAGVKGKLGRLLGIFEQHNQDRKHRTYVYALIVTETLEDWEDSVNIGRKRKWFKVEDAIRVLQSHKPVHAEYLCRLVDTCSPPYGPVCCPRAMDSKAPHYVVCSAQDSELFNR